jgi:photosystem II stability/assembly factor-like uncharacterized protein
LPGAEIQAVAFDPAAAGIALAGAAGGQIFRSTNGGATWSRHPLGTPGAHINAIAFAPATPGLVYAATSCLYACNGAICRSVANHCITSRAKAKFSCYRWP